MFYIMKKLLGIVVLGYRILKDNSTQTRHRRDKTRIKVV